MSQRRRNCSRYRGPGACQSCGHAEESHQTCAQFKECADEPSACESCGRHEFDHKSCHRSIANSVLNSTVIYCSLTSNPRRCWNIRFIHSSRLDSKSTKQVPFARIVVSTRSGMMVACSIWREKTVFCSFPR